MEVAALVFFKDVTLCENPYYFYSMGKVEMFFDERSGIAERHQITKKNVFISFGSIKYYKISFNSLMVFD